jgi:predicted house-cleaning noncanonical NTP pyrophosphatase (MazG superfamily)
METILLVITIALMCIICFITGVKTGQKVVKGETVELPNLNPVKAIKKEIKEYKENKEYEAENEYYKAILHNADAYGTNKEQVKVPERRK